MRSPPDALTVAHNWATERLRYQAEAKGRDDWLLPGEALRVKRVDCEDFAGVVLAWLAGQGWPRERLKIGICVLGDNRVRHAAAIATEADGTEWIIDPARRDVWGPLLKAEASEYRDWAFYDGGAWRHEGG